MKIARPAVSGACMLRCRPRFGLDVALATPSTGALRTPCLHGPGCAGPGYELYLACRDEIFDPCPSYMVKNIMPLNLHEISGLAHIFHEGYTSGCARGLHAALPPARRCVAGRPRVSTWRVAKTLIMG